MRKTTLISTLQPSNVELNNKRNHHDAHKNNKHEENKTASSIDHQEILNNTIKAIEKDFETSRRSSYISEYLEKIRSLSNSKVDEIGLSKQTTAKLPEVKKIYKVIPFPGFINNNVNLLSFQEKVNFGNEMNPNDNSNSKSILYEMSEANTSIIKQLPLSSLGRDERLTGLFQNNLKSEDFFQNKENYFNFIREYSSKETNASDIHNSLLLLVSKLDNKAYYLPVNSKHVIKKYVQTTSNDFRLAEELLLSKKRQQISLKDSSENNNLLEKTNEMYSKLGFKLKKVKSEVVKKGSQAINNVSMVLDDDNINSKMDNLNKLSNEENAKSNKIDLMEVEEEKDAKEDIDDLLF